MPRSSHGQLEDSTPAGTAVLPQHISPVDVTSQPVFPARLGLSVAASKTREMLATTIRCGPDRYASDLSAISQDQGHPICIDKHY